MVFALGLSAISDPSKNIPYLEGEFVDREELTLPDIQRDLVRFLWSLLSIAAT